LQYEQTESGLADQGTTEILGASNYLRLIDILGEAERRGANAASIPYTLLYLPTTICRRLAFLSVFFY
jgi:hypothetical protein